MLNDAEIDYLLELRDARPILPEKTVRVILGALNWKPESIERGLQFLHQPEGEGFVTKDEKSNVAEQFVSGLLPTFTPPKIIEVSAEKRVYTSPLSVNIKQKPFPIHSNLIHGEKKSSEEKKGFFSGRKGVVHGVITGFTFFVSLLIIYAYFSTV